MLKKLDKNVLEFLRYIVIGGSAFVIDVATMYIFKEFVFRGNYVYLAVFIGYTVGLIYNFFFSCKWVFTNGFSKIKGKELSAFIIFTIIGILGLIFTELLMKLFVGILGIYYVFAKIITGAIVMFWNYIARKIIIFDKGEKDE